MRVILTWLDQLRRTTVQGLPAFCAALVAQLEEIAAATNTWGAVDHESDGTHAAVRFTSVDATPEPTATAITLYWDGTNLKYLKPDGTTGNVV
jgi:hypothetical protein